MSGALSLSPACGSALRSLKLCRENVPVRICAGRGRAHRSITGSYRLRTNPVRLNFCRHLAGSFLPFVHDANQPTNGIFHRFSLSPVLSLPTVHAPKHERSFLKCLTNALKGQSK